MPTRYIFRKLISGLSLMLFFLAPVYTAAKTLPSSRQAYTLDSGIHDGVVDGFKITFKQIVHLEGARWLRLHFGSYHLGKKSYVTITSLKDGALQRFNEQSLGDYNNSSAYFNGDSVEVKLHVAHGETGIYFRLEEITADKLRIDTNARDSLDSSDDFAGICGTDDRVSTDDPRVGRLRQNTTGDTCSAYIISNGALLTAGHCRLDNGPLLHFNVPPSRCDGFPNEAKSEDIYFVHFSSGYPIEVDGGNGDDYAVFKCGTNSITGLSPVQAQGAFYRLSLDETPTTVRVTGFGGDAEPPGCSESSDLNKDSLTLQTDSGNFSGEFTDGPVRVYIQYEVDTAGANSGSPVIVDSNGVVIGIHTTGDCPNHKGTSFKNAGLKQAIQEFEGQNVIYVDKGHPAALEDGSVFRPYNTVGEGIAGAISGETVSIVTGSYDESMVISKSVILGAPVGNVIIGQ